MICGGEAWMLYQALKLHFTSDAYDVFKYNFHTNCKRSSFEKRPDRFQFEKLAKMYRNREDYINFLVANLSRGDESAWSLIEEDKRETYEKWLAVRDSITYVFKQDAEALRSEADKRGMKFDDLFNIGRDLDKPPAIKLQVQGIVRLESLILTDNLIGFMARADKYITETIWWPDYYRRFTKYRPFLNWVDAAKTRKILITAFS